MSNNKRPTLDWGLGLCGGIFGIFVLLIEGIVELFAGASRGDNIPQPPKKR